MKTPQRSTKLRLAVTAFALTAAVTAGGVALAGPAAAAELGKVKIFDVKGSKGSDPYWDTWKATWGKAWDECRKEFPKTKSIDMLSYDYYDSGNTRYYSGYWSCRDTS